MSHTHTARFPQGPIPRRDNDPDAAHLARERILALPDPYLAHASPSKEDLVGAIDPVSAAATAGATAGPIPMVADGDAATAPASEASGAPAEATAAATSPLEKAITAPTTATGTGIRVAPPPKSRSLPSRLRPLIIGVLTFIGLFLIFKAPIFLSQLNYLTQPKTATGTATQASLEVPAAPIISIPKINVNAPVVYATDNNENNILTDLQSGVVHYANTPVPGQPGNSVIFGHSSNDWWEPGNYKFVFVLLDKLQPGDTFTVNYQSHQYLYQVIGSKVVLPTDLSVLDQTPDPEMTLITCTPPGTSWKRLVVTAKQISPAPTTAKAATPATAAGSGNSLPSNSPSLTQQIGSWWQGIVHLLGGKSKTPTTPAAAGTAPSGSLPGN